MHITKHPLILVLLIIVLHIPLFAGGAFVYEIGSPDLGLASAGWSARADDPSTVFTNPAGMTRLKRPQFQIGIEPIYNQLKFHPNSKTTIQGSNGNASGWLPAGSLFLTGPVNENVHIGIGTVGYWGSSINYGKHWVGRYYVEKITLQGFSLVPAFAVKLGDHLSFGVGANIMYGILREKSAIRNSLDGSKDGQLKIRDSKIRTGCILGLLYEFTPRTRFGIQYISRVKLPFKDKPKFTGLGPTLKQILAVTGLSVTDIDVKVNVPQSVMGSMYHEIDSKIAVVANIGWQQWSKFNSTEILLSAAPVDSLSFTQKLKNSWHSAAGLIYTIRPNTKVTCGLACDGSVVTKKHRTLNFPVGEQWRFGVGCQQMYTNNFQISAGYELLYSGTLRVDQDVGPLAGRVAGKFRRAKTHFFTIALTKFF